MGITLEHSDMAAFIETVRAKAVSEFVATAQAKLEACATELDAQADLLVGGSKSEMMVRMQSKARGLREAARELGELASVAEAMQNGRQTHENESVAVAGKVLPGSNAAGEAGQARPARAEAAADVDCSGAAVCGPHEKRSAGAGQAGDEAQGKIASGDGGDRRETEAASMTSPASATTHNPDGTEPARPYPAMQT